MRTRYNVYCDESCHLQTDHAASMALGALWCSEERVPEIVTRLRDIRRRHQIPVNREVKWVKVSPAKLGFYHDLIDYFFDDDDLHLRILVVPDKSLLGQAALHGTHDDGYYAMYFELLKAVLRPEGRYRIYLDYKDTHGGAKSVRLHDALANSVLDFDRAIVERVQIVRSHQVELLQLTDLLLGAVSYANRNLAGSTAKTALVNRMRERSRYSLTRPTLYAEQKTNISAWSAAG